MADSFLAVLNYNMDGVGDSRWIVYGTDPAKYVTESCARHCYLDPNAS